MGGGRGETKEPPLPQHTHNLDQGWQTRSSLSDLVAPCLTLIIYILMTKYLYIFKYMYSIFTRSPKREN